MRLIGIIISFILLFYSCADKNNTTNNNFLIDTLATDKNSNKNLSANLFLTYHLAFDSSKTLIENLYNGWIDTFSIDKQNFCLKFDTASKDYENICIEQLKNGKWQKLFNLYLCSDEYGKDDINNDGYTDFIKFYHSRHYIYFYNPLAKTITDTVCIMPEEVTIIDKEKFILYNYYEAMYGKIYQSSQLYDYKQGRPYFFYELLLITNDSTNIDKMNLYKYKHGNSSDTFFVKTISSGQNLKFDYKNYWTKHIKELMK